MDINEYVVSAGRALLDMVEREWQPLSALELDQRLDQTVEQILEAELLGKRRAQPPPAVYVQVIPGHDHVEPQGLHTEASTSGPTQEEAPESNSEDTVDSCTVKLITDLLQSCESRARMAGRARLSLSHTVLLSLTLLSKRVSYRSVSARFGLEKGNIHRIFFSFCERINTLKEQQIRWPVGKEAEEHVFQTLPALLGTSMGQDLNIHQVLGVLGHTRIPVRLPLGKHDVDSTAPEVKKLKKEAHPDSWINLELVCDRKGRFLHCGIAKGSDMDAGQTLTDKLHALPGGCVLVARAGYPPTAQVLTPYTGTLGAKEQLFNRALEPCFRTLDQAVTQLKGRFQRLQYLDIANYDRAKAVVLTACVLHNILLDMRKENQSGGDEEEEGLAEEVGLVHEDGGLTHEDEGLTQEDGGLTHEDGGLTHEDEGLTHEDEGLTHEDEGLTHEDEGLTHEDEGLTHEDEGLTHEDEGLTHEDEGLTHEDEGLTHEDEGLTHEDEGLTHEDEGLTHEDEGLTHEDEGLTHEEEGEVDEEGVSRCSTITDLM